MERLTEHWNDKYIRIKGCSSLYSKQERKGANASNAVARLAAYEDTGLEPEEIPTGLELANAYATMLLLKRYQALGPIEEMSALVKARNEGRAVVLDEPRKPLVWGDDYHDTCLCPDCGKDLMGLYACERMVLQCPSCGQYVDTLKAITRAEAEAALGGGEDG